MEPVWSCVHNCWHEGGVREKNQGIRIVIYLAIKAGTSGRKVAEEESEPMNGGSQHQEEAMMMWDLVASG